MNVSKEFEYQTLEQQIISLWKSRGMDVHTIEFHTDKSGFHVWAVRVKIKDKRG